MIFITYQGISKAYISLREPDANLNTRTYLAIFLIAASFAMTTVTLAPAFADKHSADPGLETADNKIHEHSGLGSKADQGFHQGTCSGGFDAGDNNLC